MTIPPKLRAGDEVRLIAPSCTIPAVRWMTDEYLSRAKAVFSSWGCTVTEGKYIHEMDALETASIAHRVEDIHDAFRDTNVKLITTFRGGWNCNQLLGHLDYGLIGKNPKIFCGFSDITALSHAIYAKTGLVTYSGPNFYSFCYGSQLQYSFDHYQACLMKDNPIVLEASKTWSDDRFSDKHEKLQFEPNEGWWILHEGEAEGTLLGSNLCTLNLLQGTEFMPDIRGSILFLEDDHESAARTFDRDLQSLLYQPHFSGVRGLVIGRFQKTTANGAAPVTRSLLEYIIRTKPELKNLPIIANVDFGHTQPNTTYPIGGTVRLRAGKERSEIMIVEH